MKIIAAPQAWIGLHARAVLLISAPTLEVLSAEELAGMSAHEIGHEFQWSEREAAYARGDAGLLRELELVSDAIGAITLKQMGLAEEVLVSALEKVYRYNRVRFGAASNEEAYPSLQERRKVILRAASRAAVRTE